MADSAGLAEDIDFCEIDDFISASAEDCSEHEQAEAARLVNSDRRWHGEFLPAHEDFDQGRPVILESLRNHRFNCSTWCLGPEPEETRRLRHLCEIWVDQVCSKINDAGGFHFQLDKSQRIILEDNHLDRQLQLLKQSRSPMSIVKPPSPDNEITWPPG